jgi:hypothetical protein
MTQKSTKKRADELTTEEAMKRLFPKRVREVAKRVAEESKPKEPSIEKDAT